MDSDYTRRVANGIYAFVYESEGIQIRYRQSDIIHQSDPAEVDGVISPDPVSLREFAAVRIPCINVGSHRVAGVPQVCTDNQAVCELIFNHFRERNFPNLAILVDEGWEVLRSRKDPFIRICEEHGYVPYVIEYNRFSSLTIENQWLVGKLKALPKPAGMMLLRDSQGPRLFTICRELNIRIPEDLAVVGINNIPLFTSFTAPVLSSVDINAEYIGYLAASCLVKMIRGEAIPASTLVAPRELVLRQSSSISIQLDPNLSKAVDYMRANLQETLEFEDILRQQGLGRRALENHFKKRFGECPMKYLRTLRLEKVKLLLETTDLSVTEIGWQCGLGDINYLCRLFRQISHLSPLQFRQKSRTGDRSEK